MWLFEGWSVDPHTVILAQLAVEALLVVMVAILLLRRPTRPKEPVPGEGVMAATENLLKRLEEKRRALEAAMGAIDAKRGPAASGRAVGPRAEEVEGGRRHPLEQASVLAARGLNSAQIARRLGVPRAEVEMFLSLRGGAGRRP